MKSKILASLIAIVLSSSVASATDISAKVAGECGKWGLAPDLGQSILDSGLKVKFGKVRSGRQAQLDWKGSPSDPLVITVNEKMTDRRRQAVMQRVAHEWAHWKRNHAGLTGGGPIGCEPPGPPPSPPPSTACKEKEAQRDMLDNLAAFYNAAEPGQWDCKLFCKAKRKFEKDFKKCTGASFSGFSDPDLNAISSTCGC